MTRFARPSALIPFSPRLTELGETRFWRIDPALADAYESSLASNNIGWVEVKSLLAGQALLDCTRALVCEHLFFSCLERIERLRRNVLWANLLHLKALGHVGVHEADVQSQHLRPFLAQLDA